MTEHSDEMKERIWEIYCNNKKIRWSDEDWWNSLIDGEATTVLESLVAAQLIKEYEAQPWYKKALLRIRW